MNTDCDDAGALASLHTLADKGKVGCRQRWYTVDVLGIPEKTLLDYAHFGREKGCGHDLEKVN